MDKYGLLKNEYLYEYFFGIHITDPFWYIRTILPFVLTALYIWLFIPYVLNRVYKYEIRFKVDRKIVKTKEESRFLKEKNKLEEKVLKSEQNKALKEEAQRRQVEANPQLQWDKDFEELQKKDILNKTIGVLKNIIYAKNGCITDSLGTIDVDIESLTICESYGLIERNKNNSRYITATDKGWYFIKKST